MYKTKINGYDLITFEKGDRKEYKTVPDDFLLSERFVDNVDKILEMELRPDDIWVVTPPKCGTTWMQEIVWCICNNMNLQQANSLIQFYRFPFINACFSSTFKTVNQDGKPSHMIFGRTVEGYGSDITHLDKSPENLQLFVANSYDYTISMPSPRFIKTHLSLHLLPKTLLNTCKVIYVARNVKDICVSTFYQKRAPASFQQHAEAFKAGDVMIGNWFEHMKQAWDQRDHANLQFVWYEDMKDNINGVIKDVANFLEKKISERQVEQLEEHVQVDKFRRNMMVNKFYEMAKDNFVRRGVVGDWKNHFDKETDNEWNVWIERELQRTGLNMRGWK